MDRLPRCEACHRLLLFSDEELSRLFDFIKQGVFVIWRHHECLGKPVKPVDNRPS
jgi:hypothetical protein